MHDTADRPVRLGIDLGTSNTVACLRRGDGPITPLLFDASPLLSSAVFVGGDATILTGADATRAAGSRPEGFEPSPKHRIDDAHVWLGDREVSVVDLLGAVLRRVGDEAHRVAGEAPTEVVLTCPAAWSRTRLAVLADAARRAGMENVGFVREPVAAAAYFAAVLGRDLPAGQSLVVYDFGAGTFDVSVVRPAPGGVEVLATDGLTDAGGDDLDALVVGLVRASAPAAPDVWGRLDWPTTSTDRRARRMLWFDARAAKEQLSRHSAADIHIPLAELDAHVTRDEFERAARACLDRTVQLTVAALRSAGVRRENVGGVLLVGGSSRVPLVASLVHRALDIAPTVTEQPELIVAHGSLYAAPALPDAAPSLPHDAPAPAGPEPTTVSAVEAPEAVPASMPEEVPVATSGRAAGGAAGAPLSVATAAAGDVDVGGRRPRASTPSRPDAAVRRRRARGPVAAVLVATLVIATAGALWFGRQDSARGKAEAGSSPGPAITSTAASAVPAASNAPSTPAGTAPPTATAPTTSAGATKSAPPPTTSVSRRTPGCRENDSRVVWNPVRAGVSCSSNATTVTKQVGWDNGYFKSYAELRMSLRDQQLPVSYTVSVTVGGLSAPDLTVNRGGCGGIAVHTSPDGTAYDYFNVCRDGYIEIVRVVDSNVLQETRQTRQITPGTDESPSFDATVSVTASAVTVTVSNRAGESASMTLPAVSSATSYIALVTTWRDAGATASFSDFTYRPGA